MTAVSLSQQQLLALGELIRVGISVIDLVDPDDPETWVIAFNNSAASEASRTDVARFRGKRFLESFPAVRDTPFIALYQQVQRSRQEIELPEITFGDAHVPEAAFRVWLTPLPGTAVLGQYVNVTEQRKAEGRLRAANAELEARVHQRTRALRLARRQLQEVANAAAHDLSTPVHHLALLAELWGRAQDSERKEYATRMQAAAAHVREQLEGLMRYTAHRPESPVAAFDPAATLEAVLAELPAAPDAEIERDMRLTTLSTHEDQFALILHHLLKNALLYVEPGEAPKVSVELDTDGAGATVLRVRDAGLGIPEDQQRRVFSAFYRLHSQSEYPGVGMGLTLCRQAADTCGGTLTVTSTLGHGSCFELRLPAATS